MGAFLALASAVCYGLVVPQAVAFAPAGGAPIAGGMLSRRVHFASVTLLGQLGGLLLATAAALLVPAPSLHPADLGWGALSGVGSGAAMLLLNRGLSRGAMSVVVPVSAVTSVALSVLCGVLVLGDRPTPPAWAGIVAAVPALWLVSGGAGGAGRGTTDGLPASAGVAVQYLALAQAGASSGLWPVAAGRLAAVTVLLPAAVRHVGRAVGPGHTRLPDSPWTGLSPARGAQALLVGAGAALGLILYLLATRRQMLALAVVLASLYPALPVVLGIAVLRERVTRRQAVGLLGAAAAIVLLTLG
ncbi:GRP family sugar transporter [Streptomyces sp. Li-HN-5-11]|uniref:EamA family transporter n=1 Tax=Streptomyces sp. Li-HN-5-11 TaxID=3075432 RepID=UPI0028AFF098|nr:GRP family sugar transporter [Streptomyces sp. Li-HN-5-11]WNM33027.1 GRP family sugar transporter [Streptomyces sp. Li-HN-5-11]